MPGVITSEDRDPCKHEFTAVIQTACNLIK